MGERTGEDPLRSRAPHPPHTSHDDQCNRRHSSHISQYAYDRVRAESTQRDRSVARRNRSYPDRFARRRSVQHARAANSYLLKRLKRVIASRRSVITLSATHVGIGRHVRDATERHVFYTCRLSSPSYRRRKAKGAVALGRVGCERRVSPRVRGPSPRFACGGHPQRPLPQG